jgi:hypothetical protein
LTSRIFPEFFAQLVQILQSVYNTDARQESSQLKNNIFLLHFIIFVTTWNVWVASRRFSLMEQKMAKNKQTVQPRFKSRIETRQSKTFEMFIPH